MKRRWQIELLTCVLECSVLAACPARERPSQVDDQVVRIKERLATLNQCQTPDDCADMGFVCGIGCHVAVAKTNWGDAKQAITAYHLARLEDAECSPLLKPCMQGPCDKKCYPFFGYSCASGRCVASAKAPDEDICWLDDKRTPCEVVLRYLSSAACLKACDGKAVNGARIGGITDTWEPTGRHGHTVAVDFIRCSHCPPPATQARSDAGQE